MHAFGPNVAGVMGRGYFEIYQVYTSAKHYIVSGRRTKIAERKCTALTVEFWRMHIR